MQMDAYERLRTEIVRSAVKDLQRAYRKSDRLGGVCKEQISLEKWFRSQWGQLLSGDNGEYIIEKCRKTYKAPTHANGKRRMPDDVQKQICVEYHNKVRPREICKKYGISSETMHQIIRRWEA